MAHPYAGQAKSSLKRRLGVVGATAGKAHGYSSMYKATSYPSKNAGSETAFTLKGKGSKPKSGHFAIGGLVGGAKKKGGKKGGNSTNVNIVMPQKDAAGPQPVPVPVPVPAGGPPPMGAAPRPVGPPPAGLGGPPRPPGMKFGGFVKKADGTQPQKPEKGSGKPPDDMQKDNYAGFPKDPKKPAKLKFGGGVKKAPPMPKLTGGAGGGRGRLEEAKATFKGASS